MNKPEWKDAPCWANHLAMDASGDWYWYEKKPVAAFGDWSGDARFGLAAELPDYDSTLEARP
jgi:hypothetical protein